MGAACQISAKLFRSCTPVGMALLGVTLHAVDVAGAHRAREPAPVLSHRDGILDALTLEVVRVQEVEPGRRRKPVERRSLP